MIQIFISLDNPPCFGVHNFLKIKQHQNIYTRLQTKCTGHLRIVVLTPPSPLLRGCCVV